jgi:hypothetical protein
MITFGLRNGNLLPLNHFKNTCKKLQVSHQVGLLCSGKKAKTPDGLVYLDVAKAEDVADPRRQGRSRTWVLRTLDNKGDAASHGFPEG